MAWYSKFAQKWLFLVVCIVNSKPKSLVFNSPSPTWAKNLNPDRAQSPFQLVLSRFVSQTGRIRDFFRWPSSFGQKEVSSNFLFIPVSLFCYFLTLSEIVPSSSLWNSFANELCLEEETFEDQTDLKGPSTNQDHLDSRMGSLKLFNLPLQFKRPQIVEKECQHREWASPEKKCKSLWLNDRGTAY